jgi:hypothetical protein
MDELFQVSKVVALRGFEVKYTDAPRITSSHRSALEHLKLDSLTLACPGNPLEEKIRVCGLTRLIAVGTR